MSDLENFFGEEELQPYLTETSQEIVINPFILGDVNVV
jgi:hypothetical protein